MNICVIGDGNIAHAIAAYIGNKDGINVDMYITSSNNVKEDISGNIISAYTGGNVVSRGKVNLVSGIPDKVIPQADMIIFTIPTHVREKIIKQIKDFIKKDVIIGSFPAPSGFDRLVEKYVNDPVVFGVQRVPYIARILKYGESVYAEKKDVPLKIIANKDINIVVKIISDIFDVDTYKLDNFLEISLSNSNPLLHSSRLYSLFKDYTSDVFYPNKILFYEGWDNLSSKILLEMDAEFMSLVNSLGLKNVIPLNEHYDVMDAKEMTAKIRSIESFKNIYVPMIKNNKGFIPDFNSRYFLEDVDCGLKFIIDCAKENNISTPVMDIVYKNIKKLY